MEEENDEWSSPEGRKRLLELEQRPKTQAYKKMWNFFNEIVQTEHFINRCLEIRKKCRIPINGFKTAKEFYSWRHLDKNSKSSRILMDLSLKLSSDYELGYGWADTIEEFVGANIIQEMNEQDISLCEAVSEKELHDEPLSKWLADDFNNTYPVSIRLSPYATKRDILNYVELMYTGFIKPIQDTYKKAGSKIGKIRKRNALIQERNELIYQNRNKPYKEIYKLLPVAFRNGIDEGGIGKIISLENNRRKKV